MAKRTRTPAQKRKEALEKKRKYRAVVNATGDAELARLYSRRSSTRIAYELGIIVPDKMPRLVDDPPMSERMAQKIYVDNWSAITMAKRTRTPAQKRKEALDRKRKYRTVVNATGDAKLAKAYSGRSSTRIAYELGIIVPDKTPRPVAKSTRLKRRQEVITYIEKTAFIERKRRPWMPPIGVKPPKPAEPEVVEIEFDEDESGRRRAPKSEDIPDVNEEKRDQWIRWNVEKNYPEKMEERAHKINRSMNFDDGARYGWAVLYFMYVYGVSEARAKSWITSESYEGGDLYQYLVAVFG